MSRAIAQVNGAARDPTRTIGKAEAIAVGPMIATNGAWMNEASGSQCALDGIGKNGVGRDLAPDLGKDPDEIDVETMSARERAGNVDVVEGVRIGRVREHDHESRPDEKGEPVQEQGDTHGRCSVAPAPVPADRYERPNRHAILGR